MEHWSKKLHLNKVLILSAWILAGSCSGEEAGKEKISGSDSAGISVTKSQPMPPKTVDANDPRLDGNEYEEKYADGRTRIKGYVLGGFREGQWMSFYPNGKPWSHSIYKRGKLNGPTATYYENGKMRYKGAYREDDRIGKWEFWDEQGNKIEEIDYTPKP